MEASVISTPLHEISNILELFLGEGTYLELEIVHKSEKCSLKDSSHMQNIEIAGYSQLNHNL